MNDHLINSTMSHDNDAERTAIASIMVYPENVPGLMAQLQAEDFYSSRHQAIWQAATDLFHAGETVDLVTVNGKMRGNENAAYLASLLDFPVITSDLKSHVAIIKKATASRRVIEQLNAGMKAVLENGNDPNSTIEDIVKKVSACKVTGGQDQYQIQLESAIMSADEFCSIAIEKKLCHLKPYLKSPSMGIVSGARGVGKTFFVWGMVDAVTAGKTFGPWSCERPASALILDGEMSDDDTQERFAKMSMTGSREKIIYIYSEAYASQNSLPVASLTSEQWRSAMLETLKSSDIELFVIDNIASLAPGIDENSKQDWDAINQWLIRMRFAGISTLLLHHTNKDGGQRGTSAREDNLDYSIILKKPASYNPEDGARFVAHFTKKRVATTDLHMVADTEFHMMTDEHGHYYFSYENVGMSKKEKIKDYLNRGMKHGDIADIVGVSKGYVSQIKNGIKG